MTTENQAPEGALRAWCRNCEARQSASFRLGEDASTGEPYEDICCDECHFVIATVSGRAALAAQPQDAQPTWTGAVALIQHAQNVAGAPGHWPDEYLAWYSPIDWEGEHRAAAVFLGQKFGLLNDAAETLRGRLADVEALCEERGRRLYDGEASAESGTALSAEDRTRARNLAYQCRSHAASRGLDDIEQAGEIILALLGQPVMANGLTDAETSETASVKGLTQASAEGDALAIRQALEVLESAPHPVEHVLPFSNVCDCTQCGSVRAIKSAKAILRAAVAQ